MKKFKNVYDYDEYLYNEYEFGLDDCEMCDFQEFVRDNEYEIVDCVNDIDVEDNILIMNNKYYYIVERCDGIRFVEIDDDKVAQIKTMIKI